MIPVPKHIWRSGLGFAAGLSERAVADFRKGHATPRDNLEVRAVWLVRLQQAVD
jgi:hypothetical protein